MNDYAGNLRVATLPVSIVPDDKEANFLKTLHYDIGKRTFAPLAPRHGESPDSPEKVAQRPEKPCIFHQKARLAPYNRLLDEFDAGVCAIVKKMNAALPEEVRSTLKEAV